MSNVIRLWDTLFSDPDRFEFLNFVCVAIVELKRDDVIDGDFAQCMETLQRGTDSVNDVRELLNMANKIYGKYIYITSMKDDEED